MSRAKVQNKKWLPLAIFQDLSSKDLHKIILICGGSLNLRIHTLQGDNEVLELLCSSEKDLELAEVMVNQALADLRLREQISAKSDTTVEALLNSILMRSQRK